MRRFAVVLLFVAGSARAQDVPIEQLLLPKEGWHEVAGLSGKPIALAADGAGNVYVADADQRLLLVNARGEVSSIGKTSAVVGGLAVSEGSVYATLPSKRQIVRFDKGKEVVVHEDVPARDLLVAGGRIWYTAPEKKAVFLARRKSPVAMDLGDPSGLTLWKGSTLVVGDAAGRRLYAFRVLEDGGLDAREAYCAPYVRPKESSEVRGFARDAKGMLYAATKEGVQVFDRGGRRSAGRRRTSCSSFATASCGGATSKRPACRSSERTWRRRGASLHHPPPCWRATHDRKRCRHSRGSPSRPRSR
jgi:sugar lactone lactonase YvrE